MYMRKMINTPVLTYLLWFPVCVFFTEQPFYIKEIYLPTDCSDCLAAYEEINTGKDSFTSLLFFSKKYSFLKQLIDPY